MKSFSNLVSSFEFFCVPPSQPGADITKHDGIYSGCFTNYTVDGLYGVGLKVENDGAAELIDFPASLSPPRTVGSDSNSGESTGKAPSCYPTRFCFCWSN